MMEKVTLGCQELRDSRVCQAFQVSLDPLVHLVPQDSLASREPRDLQDLRVTWVIT